MRCILRAERLTVAWLAFAALAFASDSTRQERDAYRSAVEDVTNNEFDRAEKSLRALVAAPSLSSRARFGLANIAVLKSASSDVDGGPAHSLLAEAIDEYRRLLDAGPDSSLTLEDLRHNLELAKRLYSRPRSVNETKPMRDQPQDSKAKQDQSGSSEPDEKDDGRPSEKKDAGESQRSIGPVDRPAAGIVGAEAGPLSGSEATQRLDQALRRIESARSKRAATPTPRPRLPGDF